MADANKTPAAETLRALTRARVALSAARDRGGAYHRELGAVYLAIEDARDAGATEAEIDCALSKALPR